MHRNSQKRYVIKNAVYFITTNTNNRIEYFNENILCDLLVEDLWETQKLKRFNVFAYKINPEHLHALIQPLGKDPYSEIMRSFKTNFSRNANRVMGFDANFEKLIIARREGSRDPSCTGIPRDAGFDGMSRDPACAGPSHNAGFNGISFNAAHVSRIAKYNSSSPFPKFKWQSSFHDHIIRGRRDFVCHLEYIRRQWVKHKLPGNKYCFIDRALCAEAI